MIGYKAITIESETLLGRMYTIYLLWKYLYLRYAWYMDVRLGSTMKFSVSILGIVISLALSVPNEDGK